MSKKVEMKAGSFTEDEKFPLPIYGEEEDIYNNEIKEPLEDENNPGMRNPGNDNEGLGKDLDVPGMELDDTGEEIGEEDEENNYYSLGGDDHEDLEDDQSV